MAANTIVIVTARNEADRLGATLHALAEAFPQAAIWVADDGSSDDTSGVARAAGATLVRGERPVGKGGAATRAARAALEGLVLEALPVEASAHEGQALEGPALEGLPAGEAVVVLCDGDLGASAVRLVGLLAPLERGEADLTVAVFARRLGGGLGLAVGFARWAIRRRCGLHARAPISGQRALRVQVLADVLPFAAGFGMEIGMSIDAVRAGYRLCEVELDLGHRASGRSFAGFAHRGRQLVDFVRVYLDRR